MLNHVDVKNIEKCDDIEGASTAKWENSVGRF